MAAKRKGSTTLQGLDNKRQTIPTPTILDQSYRKLKANYPLSLPSLVDVKVLCCYLCVLLSWGYEIFERGLDDFIILYPQYQKNLVDLEAAQRSSSSSWSIPAYHQWFRAQTPSISTPTPILDEEALRQIGRDNPYTAQLTLLAMEHVQETRP